MEDLNKMDSEMDGEAQERIFYWYWVCGNIIPRDIYSAYGCGTSCSYCLSRPRTKAEGANKNAGKEGRADGCTLRRFARRPQNLKRGRRRSAGRGAPYGNPCAPTPTR